MTEKRVPLAGSTLILGPSGVGKTRLTARALQRWLDQEGTDGVVVIEFGPEVEYDGRLLGRRLDHFIDVPADVWQGILEARAPRAESATGEEALALARDNADGAATLYEHLPADPTAVFVNDATIPIQSGRDPDTMTGYCEPAEISVLNAFESDELGMDDPVSENEHRALERLKSWADRTVRLS